MATRTEKVRSLMMQELVGRGCPHDVAERAVSYALEHGVTVGVGIVDGKWVVSA